MQHAEPLAIGAGDEGQFRPARRAETSPSTGSRQAAQSGGNARSSAARDSARTTSAARLSRVGRAMLADIGMRPRYRPATEMSPPERETIRPWPKARHRQAH